MSDGIDFSDIDALLDQALALDNDNRAAFLARLPADERNQLVRLLDLSQQVTLSSYAAEAAQAVGNVMGRPNSNIDPLQASGQGLEAGQWRLHSELGSGGMGQVFYATRKPASGSKKDHADYIQQVAVKVLWSHQLDTEARARFFRERRILSSLNHPGLSRFVDGGLLADGRPWFAMEYVDGDNLIKHVDQQPLDLRIRLFAEICAAVAYAHARLIVHRDIKPQNVLVDTEGHARLLDFGVAGILEDVDDGVSTRTQGGPLTLQYASPEQVTGKLVTVASDVYQLGLLLYEMLTGTPPYRLSDCSLEQALDHICNKNPLPPSQHNRQIGTDLDAIVLTALSKDPAQRYRSVTEFADDLERYQRGRPVRAVPQSTWYLLRRFLRRNAVVAGLGLFTVASLSAATVISVNMAREARAQTQRSATAQQILSDVFQKAEPFSGSGASVTLADALIRAQPEIEQRVAQDPLLAWEVNQNLGQIYSSLGLVEYEIQAYEAAISAANALPEANGFRWLTGVAGVGSALARIDPQRAVTFLETKLQDIPTDAHAVRPWLGGQYAYVGALNRVKENERADEETRKMAQVVKQHNIADPRTQGRLSQLLAGVARRGGDTAAEDKYWLDTLNYMRQANNPSALAVTLSNRAIHLGRSARYAESDQAFTEAIEIYEEAEHQDPTYAAVLRGYAGLLFRTERRAQAIETAERATELLNPESDAYAWFVSKSNLAGYTFVTGDTVKTLQTIEQTFPVARSQLSGNPGSVRRMLPVFAKLLIFGQAQPLAAQALGMSIGCPKSAVYQALDALDPAEEKETRKRIWLALTQLQETFTSGEANSHKVSQFVAMYQSELPKFFDVLDHWRVLETLADATRLGAELPTTITTRYQELSKLKAETTILIKNQPQDRLQEIALHFAKQKNSISCP